MEHWQDGYRQQALTSKEFIKSNPNHRYFTIDFENKITSYDLNVYHYWEGSHCHPYVIFDDSDCEGYNCACDYVGGLSFNDFEHFHHILDNINDVDDIKLYEIELDSDDSDPDNIVISGNINYSWHMEQQYSAGKYKIIKRIFIDDMIDHLGINISKYINDNIIINISKDDVLDKNEQKELEIEFAELKEKKNWNQPYYFYSFCKIDIDFIFIFFENPCKIIEEIYNQIIIACEIS